MAYAKLNPIDDSTVYPFMNGYDPSGANTNKTFAEVLADINSKGFNTCVITSNHSSSYGDRYYTIISFNLPEMTDFYIANKVYITNYGQEYSLFIQNYNNLNISYTSYFYQNGSLTQTSSGNLQTIFSFPVQKDGVEYKRYDNGYEDTALACVFLTNADIDTLYVNNAPQITPIWKSIPQVSGKMGTFIFSTID